jgi:hypothetical protein
MSPIHIAFADTAKEIPRLNAAAQLAASASLPRSAHWFELGASVKGTPSVSPRTRKPRMQIDLRQNGVSFFNSSNVTDGNRIRLQLTEKLAGDSV